MTNTELKEALLSKKPVVYRHFYYGEIKCKCVNAIRYTIGASGEILVQAELLGKNGCTIMIAKPEDVYEVRK